MKKFIERFSGLVKSSISGFDRIVFKGFILPLMSAGEVMRFCSFQGILNKDYKSWMMTQTKNIIEHAERYAKDNCGRGIIHLPTWRTRKEALAHERQQQEQITSGLVLSGSRFLLSCPVQCDNRISSVTELPDPLQPSLLLL